MSGRTPRLTSSGKISAALPQRDGSLLLLRYMAGGYGPGRHQIAGLLIDIAGTQTEVDTRLLAFNIQRTGSARWQPAAGAAMPQTRCQHPSSAQATAL